VVGHIEHRVDAPHAFSRQGSRLKHFCKGIAARFMVAV
jgi:hypothetical protein